MPAAHEDAAVQVVHEVEPGAVEKLLPAAQEVQTRSAVAVHAEATKVPAAHEDASAQLLQGALPSPLQVPTVHAWPRTSAARSAAATTASGSRRGGAIREARGRKGEVLLKMVPTRRSRWARRVAFGKILVEGGPVIYLLCILLRPAKFSKASR